MLFLVEPLLCEDLRLRPAAAALRTPGRQPGHDAEGSSAGKGQLGLLTTYLQISFQMGSLKAVLWLF